MLAMRGQGLFEDRRFRIGLFTSCGVLDGERSDLG